MTAASQASIIILGTGSYVPERVVTNDDLALQMDTSDEWITSRTGIRERRFAAPGETTADMAAQAGARAIAAAGLKPDDIDLLIVATITPDMPFPSTACLVQHRLGIPTRAACFDIEAACSGFIFSLEIAASMIRTGAYRHALIIGAEKLTSILDWQDRTTCVLFGDGAGAAVVGRSAGAGTGLLGNLLGADGSEADLLNMPGGGSACPSTPESLAAGRHFLKMRGKEVFKNAVRVFEQSAQEILARTGLHGDQIALFIPHQANMRIIETFASRLEVPLDRFYVNLDRYGNTSAASIPIALDEALREGRIHKGDHIMLLAFGAGLTWAASVIRWH